MVERVRIDIEDRVAVVRLDNPPLNVVDTELRRGLDEVVAQLAGETGVHAVVLTGGERAFAAGADIDRLAAMGFEEVWDWNRALQKTFGQVAALPMPVVAAVEGYALGGGLELAMCADHRIAGGDAVLAQPEVLLGIIPGSGGTQRLTRLVGPARAKQLLMTGRRVQAAEALALGLVDEVVDAGTATDAAREYAARLAAGPRFALQAVKSAVDHGAQPSLEAGLALERSLIAGLFATRDREIGMRSFREHGPGRARFGTTPQAGEPAPTVTASTTKGS